MLDSGKLTYRDYLKAKNFIKIAELADQYYEGTHDSKNDCSDTYSFDWFLRFYDAVSNISNEEMQQLWAKIFAGEINKPSSFSLRTIEVLRNMSKEEALLFQKIYSYSFRTGNKCFIPNYDDCLSCFNITFDDILTMGELGLMKDDATLSLNFNINSSPTVLCINNSLVILANPKENKNTISIKHYPLTQVGKEIASIFDVLQPENNCLCFARILEKEFDIEVYRYIQKSVNTIEWYGLNLLKNNTEQ